VTFPLLRGNWRDVLSAEALKLMIAAVSSFFPMATHMNCREHLKRNAIWSPSLASLFRPFRRKKTAAVSTRSQPGRRCNSAGLPPTYL
jgi:hypothetical protein